MEKHKLDRIQNLKDEVKELHPILHVLFKKLPNIINVEYTHGIDEMGADFVLTKFDETIDDIEYIGCIVKIGTIKQDHQDVIRQIEECELERNISGGARKIFIKEIWIISNSHITYKAQEKIHHKYRNKSIKFIPSEKIVSLIDKFYQEYWRDINVQTGEYLRHIEQYAENISNNNSLINIPNSEIYVPQELNKIDNKRSYFDKKHKSKYKRLTIDNILESEDYVLIEAMMGAGKSTLLSQIAKNHTDAKTYNEKKILPIIFSAKELLEKNNGDIKEIVDEIIIKSEISDVSKFLVLIDGLDELKIESDDRYKFIEKIYDTARLVGNIQVIITTRTIDDPKLEAEIEKKYSRFRLCPLSISQVVSIVEKICKNVDIKNRLQKDLDKSHLFKVLPKTPISAILLATLLNDNLQEIPSTMTELYDKYMELSLGRWDMKKGLQSQQEYDVIKNVSICLAKFLIENSLTEISIGDTRDIFNTYTDSRNLKIDKETIFNKLTNKKEIFYKNNYKNTIRFNHRTFAEYFYALGIGEDASSVITESIYDLYWSTTFFFYIGLKRDCPEIINAINNIKFTNDSYRVLKIFNNANFLLAAYLTPYNIIKESVYDSFINAAELYEKIFNDTDILNLRKISAIQLLCVITQTLCDTFGYEFFSAALEERAQEIYTLPEHLLTESKFIELFLINSVRISFGSSEAYDTMINNYSKKIPIQIQVGMIEHASYNKSNSMIIKKYINNFKKKIKGSKGFHEIVVDYYRKPIDVMSEKLLKCK